jgi:phenylacetate-coenzyme A ligase PaaK-like adenylate-forming protein
MHPLLVRHVLYPLHERVMGKRTFWWLRELERTQWLSPAELRQYQFRRLSALLRFAYQRVPYYRQLLDEAALPPDRITSLEDFSRVPALSRTLLGARFSDLQARPQLSRVQRMSTGGSTGVPVTVVVDMHRMGFGEAARMRAHRWFHLEPGGRAIALWGMPAHLTIKDRARTVRDRLMNWRMLSAFDMSEGALAHYATVIRRYRPEKMYGYASAFHLLATYLLTTSWRPPRELRAIFTTAEPLFDFQRKTIEAAFSCLVATEYGSRDGGLAALECPDGGLHVPAEGMHVEVEGRGPDGLGEIVVTVLDSFAFPIIRYQTGDLGRLEPDPCRCGRSLPLLGAVQGRQTDFIVTPDGRCVHALAVIYPLREIDTIREFQVVQSAIDHVTVSVVPAAGFSAGDVRRIEDQLRLRLGEDIRVDVATTAAISRTAAAKFRYVVSHVAAPYVQRMLTGLPA